MEFAGNGLASVASKYPVQETLDRLEYIARNKGLTVFCRIDFGGMPAKPDWRWDPRRG